MYAIGLVALANQQSVDLAPALLEAISGLPVSPPCIGMGSLLILGELHLDLIIELDIALGNLVIHLPQLPQ